MAAEIKVGNFLHLLIDFEIRFEEVSICVALFLILLIWSWDGLSGEASKAGDELFEPEDSLEKSSDG